MARALFNALIVSPVLPGVGRGYIAGILPGIVTVNGVPSGRSVEARHRTTRRVIETAFSAPDGSYRFDGLDPAQEFDIIGRDWSGTYNDVIVSRVRPCPYAVQSATGTFTANDAAKTLDGAIEIAGGIDHAVTVTDGTAPAGITFSVAAGGPPTFDHVAYWLVASGTASAGTYTWELTVKSAVGGGAGVAVACSATFT